MEKAVNAKFSQNKELRELLMGTGSAYLAEHSRDKYWGDGMNGTGKNVLGEILMRVRGTMGGTVESGEEEEKKIEE